MACNPQIAERIRARADRGDWEFLARCFSRVPESFAFGMLRDYFERLESPRDALESDRRRAANRWIEETACAMFPANGATYTASDPEICEMAEQAAARVKHRITPRMGDAEKRAALDAICTEFGISIAHVKAGKPWVKLCRRIDGARWWRRQLRGRFRVIEHAAIRAGMVSERCPYISRMGMQRFEQEQRRAARFLDDMEMVNLDTGEIIALSAVSASNVSNPKNRFTEQVTKLKGMEAAAAVMGFTAHFVTWTCPSRMHARRTVSKGKTVRNSKYDGM
jgi:hypothetical protein